MDMNNRKNGISPKTMRLAVCAVIAALGVMLMMLTSLAPIGTYAFPCFAGALLIAVVIEYGGKWALGVYLVVSVLSAFLSGDKEAVIYFIAIFGYYPVLKKVIESRVRKSVARYIIKLAVFNAAAITSFYAAMLLLSVPAEEFTLFGVYVPLAFLAAGNLFFLLYDYALAVYARFYAEKLRSKLFKL